jgi:hypothetical protein
VVGVTVLYRRPTGTKDVRAEWEPDDEQAGADALAAVLDDVPDAATALEEAPHDLDRATAEAVREEYADLTADTTSGGGS